VIGAVRMFVYPEVRAMIKARKTRLCSGSSDR
jgi:hypothetical protein